MKPITTIIVVYFELPLDWNYPVFTPEVLVNDKDSNFYEQNHISNQVSHLKDRILLFKIGRRETYSLKI